MPEAPPPLAVDLPEALHAPQVRLFGDVGEALYFNFRAQLDNAPLDADPLVIELSTTGGDADTGRRMALDAELWRHRQGRRLIFLGKTVVYSAGVTFMAGFAVEDRFLTADTRLLIHERRLCKDVPLNAPLRACEQVVRELLAEIEASQALERDGFKALAQGSDIGESEIYAMAERATYLTASEALQRRLIAGLL